MTRLVEMRQWNNVIIVAWLLPLLVLYHLQFGTYMWNGKKRGHPAQCGKNELKMSDWIKNVPPKNHHFTQQWRAEVFLFRAMGWGDFPTIFAWFYFLLTQNFLWPPRFRGRLTLLFEVSITTKKRRSFWSWGVAKTPFPLLQVCAQMCNFPIYIKALHFSTSL